MPRMTKLVAPAAPFVVLAGLFLTSCQTGTINTADTSLPTVTLSVSGQGLRQGVTQTSWDALTPGSAPLTVIEPNPGSGTFDIIATANCTSGVKQLSLAAAGGSFKPGSVPTLGASSQSMAKSQVSVGATLAPLTDNGDQVVKITATVQDFNNHTVTTAPFIVVCNTTAPSIVTFTITPNSAQVTPHSIPAEAVDWSVTPADAEVSFTVSPTTASGSFGGISPAHGQIWADFVQSATLTLSAQTSGGRRQAAQTIQITQVATPAKIVSFTAPSDPQHPRSAQGQFNYLLSWSTTNAAFVSISPPGNLPANFNNGQASRQPATGSSVPYTPAFNLGSGTVEALTLTAFDANGNATDTRSVAITVAGTNGH